MRSPAKFRFDATLTRRGLHWPGGPTHLWLARTSAQPDQVALLGARLLNADETRRAEALRFEIDRRGFLLAHVALRVLLGAYLGMDPEEVPLTRESCPTCGAAHGRPVVRNTPLHFSMSRSGELALLAFSTKPVGVDVERVPSESAVSNLASSLHPLETSRLDTFSAGERPREFARLWTRKSAYLKGLGPGLAREPSRDYVGFDTAPVAAPGGWSINDVSADDGFSAALAEHRLPGARASRRSSRSPRSPISTLEQNPDHDA